MFVSPEQNASKKKYQKPNILRKRSKVSVVRPNVSPNESPSTTTFIQYTRLVPEFETDKKKQEHGNTFPYEIIIPKQEVPIDVLQKSCVSKNNQLNDHECVEQVSLNVESFLNGAAKQEPITSLKQETAGTEDWCFDGLIDTKQILLNSCERSQVSNKVQKSDISLGNASSTVVSSLHQDNVVSSDVILTAKPSENVIIDCFTSRPVKLKCDEPNCSKGFWSELRLKKHKSTHNKQSRVKATSAVAECPVKKINEDGVEEQCGRTFLARKDLSKHLNEDHSPDDALYRCEACGRRFFWAVGLRAHRQAQCARGALACGWPGCGRVFRQPCRLREHARAHTGDRPYACPFPDCGWSFRSASKLQRHARRHTGERRYGCTACGRAFRRREHLRDHCARCHPHGAPRTPRAPRTARTPRAPRVPRAPRASTRARSLGLTGSEDPLSIDPKICNVGRKCEFEDGPAIIQTAAVQPQNSLLVLSLLPEAKMESVCDTVEEIPCTELEVLGCGADAEEAEETESEEGVEGSEEAEVEVEAEGGWGAGRAARTHCTWPLAPRRAAPAPRPAPRPDPRPDPRTHAAFVLEEDAPVEQSETSENNIYTIRSDLFLHGNVLINEDSELVVSGDVPMRGTEAAPEPLEPLHYADVHPTIDLMPEELMYADAAVDESSFRVFLMNGEELT